MLPFEEKNLPGDMRKESFNAWGYII